MRRRKVLTSCGLGLGALAGCITLGQQESESIDSRTVSVEETNTNLPSALQTTVSIERGKITDEETAEIDIILQNTGSTEYSLLGGSDFPFSRLSSEDEAWLLLDDATPGERRSGCWEPEPRGYGEDDVAYTYDVGPGDKFSKRYELWGSPQDDICMPTGAFWFNHTYRDTEREKSYSWNFQLSITEASN